MPRKCAITILLLFAASIPLNGVAQTGPCATQIGPKLPDLFVDEDKLRSQVHVTEETFSPTSCTFLESCISRPGTHLLLRFTSNTPNVGEADLVIGDPNECLGTLFRFSECHQHLHFEEYADYRLWTPAGYDKWVRMRDLSKPSNEGRNAQLLKKAFDNRELLVGRKQGFCIIDLLPYNFEGATPPPPKYVSCASNQGLQVGYADEYHFGLSCQFVEVTDLPEGDYVLEDHVNAEHLLPESDFTNNSSAVRFHFTPKQGKSGPTVVVQ